MVDRQLPRPRVRTSQAFRPEPRRPASCRQTRGRTSPADRRARNRESWRRQRVNREAVHPLEHGQQDVGGRFGGRNPDVRLVGFRHEHFDAYDGCLDRAESQSERDSSVPGQPPEAREQHRQQEDHAALEHSGEQPRREPMVRRRDMRYPRLASIDMGGLNGSTIQSVAGQVFGTGARPFVPNRLTGTRRRSLPAPPGHLHL